MAMRHSMQGQIAMAPYGRATFTTEGMSKRAAPADPAHASAFVEKVAERLQMIAHVVHISQSDIARTVHVDQSTVNKWMAGTRIPDVYRMALFCDAYGCSLDFIFRGKLGNGMREDLGLTLAAEFPGLVLGPVHLAKVGEEAS